MNNIEVLKQLRHQLAEIKATTHDTVEPSVTQEIEEAIESIDLILKDSDVKEQDYKKKALSIVGKFFLVLPSVVEIFNSFLE